MKRIHLKPLSLTALLLSSLILTACRQLSAPTPTMVSSSSTSRQASASHTNSSASTSGSSTASASRQQLATGWADYFSDRDLDASYDASSASTIALSGSSATTSGSGVSVSGSTVTITAEGTYMISGSSQNVQIKVKVADTQKVQLVLDGVTMTGTEAAISVETADKVFITLAEGSTNTLSDGSSHSQETSGVINSAADLTLNGSGTLNVTAHFENAIKSKDDLKITGGTYHIEAPKHALSANDALNIAKATLNLTATEDALHSDNDEDTSLGNLYIESGQITITAGDDAIHASNDLLIKGGTIAIQSSVEGLEGKTVTVEDGSISIVASDDGINGSDWAYEGGDMDAQPGVAVTIKGGSLTINMASGDTDAIDSNNELIITGGTLNITANSAFDFSGSASYTGGTLIVNGETVTEITQAMMPGGPGGGPRGGFGAR